MAEVGIAQLQRDLKEWLTQAQAGDEVIVTDHGKPIARLTGIAVSPLFERLVAEGHVSQPRRARPQASGHGRVHSSGPVSEYVVAERDARRG